MVIPLVLLLDGLQVQDKLEISALGLDDLRDIDIIQVADDWFLVQ